MKCISVRERRSAERERKRERLRSLTYDSLLNSDYCYRFTHPAEAEFLAGVGGMAEATYYCYRFAHPAEAEQRLEVGRSVA